RVRAWTGRQHRRMTGAASHRCEEALAVPRHLVERSATDGSEELHEAREVVDAASAGARISDVLGLGNRVAHAHPVLRDADRDLLREQIVGDAPLVAIAVGPE